MPHIHEKVDFTSSVYVVNDGAVLLRKHEKYHVWLPPGGHVELHEDPTEAAVREVREETGLAVELYGEIPPLPELPNFKELVAPRFMNRHLVKGGPHTHVDSVYFATSSSRATKPGEGELSDEMRWFTRGELDEPEFGLWKEIIYYAKTALDEVKG